MRKISSLLSLLCAMMFWASLALAAVDLNTADKAALEGVKGIGPAKAQAILDYRAKNGPFKSIDDLAKVKGFGKKTVDKIRKDVEVKGAAAPAKAAPEATGAAKK
jgi:competence protein ComEA